MSVVPQVMLPSHGIDEPSEIQVQAIPSILASKTVAIQSYTGSGKAGFDLLGVGVCGTECGPHGC